MADRIDSLPKWAQQLIRTQEMALAAQKRQIADLKGSTPYTNPAAWKDPYGAAVPIAEERERIRFGSEPTGRAWLDVQFMQDGSYEIMGAGSFVIVPQANNVIRVRVDRDLAR